MTAHQENDPLVAWYSTEIWGKRIDDDDLLFEVMSLQVFQAGLTWRMVLQRRDAFRRAFRGWRIDEVAGLGPDDIDDMVSDAAIIRNRKKIEACISNAQVIQELQREHGSFLPLVLQSAGRRPGDAAKGPAADLQVHGAGDCPDVADGVRSHCG